jgi:hypothetical protein
MMAEANPLAVKRRQALVRAMEVHGLNPTTLARKCGWSSPNRIYNFMAGRSESLDFTSLQDVVKAMPGTRVEELGALPKKKIMPPVLVKTACQALHFREQFTLPANQLRELPLPLEDSARQAGAYAATVKHPGADEIYPEKTILLCLPADKCEGKIVAGMRFIVERFVGSKVEVTVREARPDSEGRFWLSHRSTDPRLAGAIKAPEKISSKSWQANQEKVALAAVVIGSFQPEVGAPG